MLNKPTALAVTLTAMKEALPRYGLDFHTLARQVGIDPELLARPNARYPSSRIQRLWQLAATESGSSDLAALGELIDTYGDAVWDLLAQVE